MMEFLSELWLPIVLSAVFVFLVSSILHMLIPIHRNDYGEMVGEEAVLEAIRAQSVRVGNYRFPYASSMKDLASPEMMDKFKQGPVGLLTVMPSGPPAMGKSLLQWFLYSVLISLFVGYIGWLALGDATGEHVYLEVFQITGAAAVLGYAFANIPESIWKGTAWSTSFKFVFDGVLYGLVTAGTFGWLWPS